MIFLLMFAIIVTVFGIGLFYHYDSADDNAEYRLMYDDMKRQTALSRRRISLAKRRTKLARRRVKLAKDRGRIK